MPEMPKPRGIGPRAHFPLETRDHYGPEFSLFPDLDSSPDTPEGWEDQHEREAGLAPYLAPKKSPTPSATHWVSGGRKIPMRDLTDQHLLNAIRYLQKTATARMYSDALQADLYAEQANGEMARAGLEDEAVALYWHTDPLAHLEAISPAYRGLLKEAERRGLQP